MEIKTPKTFKTPEQEALLFLEDGLHELRFDIQRAKNMLIDGKIISCNQRLQGLITKCNNAITYIKEIKKESEHVVEENNTKS